MTNYWVGIGMFGAAWLLALYITSQRCSFWLGMALAVVFGIVNGMFWQLWR